MLIHGDSHCGRLIQFSLSPVPDAEETQTAVIAQLRFRQPYFL
jgi:hypothetical protein